MKNILIGIPTKNTGKYLYNLFEQLYNLNYNLKNITIILVESDSIDDSYKICQNIQYIYNLSFKNIIVHKLNFGFHLNHNLDRYKKENFPNRIKNLIITRNFIVDNYLNDHDYVWWVDSDFQEIPKDTVHKFIECDKDIVIPVLTHDTWGYHDCGSVVYEKNGNQLRFQYINTENNLVKLDRADAHCFIKNKVFEKIKYKFVQESYYDGCGGIQDCYPEGASFSLDAIKNGFTIYGATHIIIKHHNV